MKDPSPAVFAKNLRRAREAADLSQVALARAAGVDLSNLNRLENGDGFPRIDTLVRLARALRTTASALLDGVR